MRKYQQVRILLGVQYDVRMPEWSNGAVCKTVIHRFESVSSLKTGRFGKLVKPSLSQGGVTGSSPVPTTSLE